MMAIVSALTLLTNVFAGNLIVCLIKLLKVKQVKKFNLFICFSNYKNK